MRTHLVRSPPCSSSTQRTDGSLSKLICHLTWPGDQGRGGMRLLPQATRHSEHLHGWVELIFSSYQFSKYGAWWLSIYLWRWPLTKNEREMNEKEDETHCWKRRREGTTKRKKRPERESSGDFHHDTMEAFAKEEVDQACNTTFSCLHAKKKS